MIAKSCALAAAVAICFSGHVSAQNSARSGFTVDTTAPMANSPSIPNATISEGFDTVAGTPPCPAGWTCTNNSAPLGTTNWFQGNDTVFPAQAGAVTSYIGANFNNTAGAGDISNWLITPVMQFGTGSELRFWSRRPTTSAYADRLEIRASTGGTNTGGGSATTGDFSILLGTINPGLSATAGTCDVPAGPPNAGGYPASWCEYLITNVQGIPTSGTGRIAFRYTVTSGGPTGTNSDYIGIDTFSFVEGAADVPPVFAYTPAPGAVTLTGGTTIGSTASTSIAVAIGTAGAGSGAAATTTVTCTAPAGFTGFTGSATATGAGAISGGPFAGTCVLGAAAVTATMTCNEVQGGTTVARNFDLTCPAGTAVPLTSTPISGSTINLPQFTLGGMGTTAPVAFQNPGLVGVTVNCTAPTATEFTVAPLSFPVPASGTASTTITFMSAVIGNFTGVLDCTAGAQAFTFNLAGSAGAPSQPVPSLGDGMRGLLALLLLSLGVAAVGLHSRRS